MIYNKKVVVVKILDLGLALLVGDDQQRLTVFDKDQHWQPYLAESVTSNSDGTVWTTDKDGIIADLLAAVPQIASTWDEPFADVSQLPTMLVARMERMGFIGVWCGFGFADFCPRPSYRNFSEFVTNYF